MLHSIFARKVLIVIFLQIVIAAAEGISRLTSRRMAERRLKPPNPNEVTIAKSFRRALMFFRVFIMTRFADDVSHRTFYSRKWSSPARQKLNSNWMHLTWLFLKLFLYLYFYISFAIGYSYQGNLKGALPCIFLISGQ